MLFKNYFRLQNLILGRKDVFNSFSFKNVGTHQTYILVHILQIDKQHELCIFKVNMFCGVCHLVCFGQSHCAIEFSLHLPLRYVWKMWVCLGCLVCIMWVMWLNFVHTLHLLFFFGFCAEHWNKEGGECNTSCRMVIINKSFGFRYKKYFIRYFNRLTSS